MNKGDDLKKENGRNSLSKLFTLPTATQNNEAPVSGTSNSLQSDFSFENKMPAANFSV